MPPQRGRLPVLIGLLDNPRAQLQTGAVIDLGGGQGNLLVVGSPQTGKSTLLRTLVLSLAATYTPGEVSVHAIDFGGSLRGLEQLPHVGTVAQRTDRERVRAVLGHALSTIEEREQLLHAHSASDMQELRARQKDTGTDRRSPNAPDLASTDTSDVFILIDGWSLMREQMEDGEALLAEIASRGLSYGLHVVVAANSPHDLRPRTMNSFGQRIELRLADAYDSNIDRKLMAQIKPSTPGRALTPDRLLIQVALPHIVPSDDHTATADLWAASAQRVRDAYPDTSVSPVRQLPQLVAARALPAIETPGHLPIGITGDHRPLVLNLEGADPHLLIFGDNESGKSTTLRLLIQQATRGRTGDQVAIAAIDYRRAHMDDIDEAHLVGYATTAENATKLAHALHGELSKRLPPADLPRQRLIDRDWWQGPELYVVIDDYELVATQAGNPLTPLAPLLPYARDIGLHVIVARRTGGASRAIFDPILQPLTELGTPVLLHSGDRSEGRIAHGTAPQHLPPGRALYASRGHIAVPVQIAMP